MCKKRWKRNFPHFAEWESGEMLIGKWQWEACLGWDLRSTADQSLAIYCLREESLIDLDDLACKLLPAAALHECMYWRRGLVGHELICIVYCLLLFSHGLLVLNTRLWSSRVTCPDKHTTVFLDESLESFSLKLQKNSFSLTSNYVDVWFYFSRFRDISLREWYFL